MSSTLFLATEAGRAAGATFGRLLFPVLGLVLLVLGLRRRSDPSTPSRGTGLIVAGAVLLVLSFVNVAGLTAQSGPPDASALALRQLRRSF